VIRLIVESPAFPKGQWASHGLCSVAGRPQRLRLLLASSDTTKEAASKLPGSQVSSDSRLSGSRMVSCQSCGMGLVLRCTTYVLLRTWRLADAARFRFRFGGGASLCFSWRRCWWLWLRLRSSASTMRGGWSAAQCGAMVLVRSCLSPSPTLSLLENVGFGLRSESSGGRGERLLLLCCAVH